MYRETFFLLIIVASWGVISYYFWFRWRRTKLRRLEESVRLDLKHSLSSTVLQLKKNVVYLEQSRPVKEAIENMEHPKKLGRRKEDPKHGIGSVVIVDKKPSKNILRTQNIVGIITLKDIIRGCYEQGYENKSLLNRRCAEIMSQDYIVVDEEAIQNDCWQVLLDARGKAVEHILIQKDNQIQGIVTDKDIFRSIEFEPR